jgi:hypothetical protein
VRIARHLLVAASVAVVAGLTGTACSLDWNVRPDVGDAPAVAEAGPDAPRDASREDAPPDASVADAPDPDGGPCPALAADLEARKTKARACDGAQLTPQCTSTVDDECGCRVIVRLAGSPETRAYVDGIAAFVAACGKPPAASCTCPQLGVSGAWKCLFESTKGYVCWPP